jgi:ribonuclease HI
VAPSAKGDAADGWGHGATHPLVAVYADESCLGNGQDRDTPGGAGGLIEFQQPKTGSIVRRDYWVADSATTNNRMALRSVIEAFRGLSTKGVPLSVVFTSDSRYLIDGFREWVFAWAARGWTRKGGPIENLALWREAIAVIRAGGHECDWRWVRGHEGHPQNEYANHLATRAAATLHESGGIVTSEFDAWLAARPTRAGRPALRAADPFPSPASFVRAPTLPDPAGTLPASVAGRRGK